LHSTGAAIDFGDDVAVTRDACESAVWFTLGEVTDKAGIDL
jgi:hypothetical protein